VIDEPNRKSQNFNQSVKITMQFLTAEATQHPPPALAELKAGKPRVSQR
jgi:hypothetical protein